MTPGKTTRLSFYTTDAAAEHYLGIKWPPAIWRTVLEQAITDAVEGLPAFELQGMTHEAALQYDTDIRVAALEWIEDPANDPRRFVWVCEQLDLEPSAVRAAVHKRRSL
jgi:hypothetical protein